MTATAIWTAVKASYETTGLVQLTNPRERAASTIDDTVGENAAQAVIDLWPSFAQEAFDSSDSAHLEAAKQGTIAVLWRRGGTATNIARVKWDEVFSPDGLIARIRRTGPRGRQGPVTNSGVTQRAENADGSNVRGWSDRESLPSGILPNRTTATD